MTSTQRLIVGCMSGTSMDGIDAALVAIEGEGLDLHATLRGSATSALPHSERLRELSHGEPVALGALRMLMRDLGEAHRLLIEELVGDLHPDLIVIHGQTVLHEPPLSWQIIDPWPVAASFACRIVTDIRSRCITSGGQGAPLTPLADWILFRDPSESRTVINLGGFANYTTLPVDNGTHSSGCDAIAGGDICPCNLVLDRISRRRLQTPYDADGHTALRGNIEQSRSEHIADRFKTADQRSLGTQDEAHWIDDHVADLDAEDALATVCDAIARGIAARLSGDTVVLAGGGVHNSALVRSITQHAQTTVVPSDSLGVPSHMREAMGFAVLGALAEDGIQISLPRITGSTAQGRAGQWILP